MQGATINTFLACFGVLYHVTNCLEKLPLLPPYLKFLGMNLGREIKCI